MKKIIALAVLASSFGVAFAQQSNTIYRDQYGQVVGTAMNNNGNVTYRDQNGQTVGTSMNNNGNVIYRDQNGQNVGTSMSNGNQYNNRQTPPPPQFYGQPQR
jgi:hypothetical protein